MVNVADQYAAAMQQLTAARTAQMLDAGVATRPTDPGQTPDLDADGNVAGPPEREVYAGPGIVADPSSGQKAPQGSVNDQGGVPNARVLRLPVDSPDLRPGDTWTVTTSMASPSLVGDQFVVVGEEERSFATYRRYLLKGSSWLPPADGTSTEPESSSPA